MYQHTIREEKNVSRKRRVAGSTCPDTVPMHHWVSRKHSWLGSRMVAEGPRKAWSPQATMAEYDDARPLAHKRDGSRFAKAERKAAARDRHLDFLYPITPGHRRVNVMALLAAAV